MDMKNELALHPVIIDTIVILEKVGNKHITGILNYFRVQF